MARKVTSMRVIAAVTAFVAGEPVNVSKVCREAGVTRKTFYKWAARYRDGGLPSLEERSRRPLSSPARTPGWVEEAIVALREELALAGLDHGALTLQWHLEQRRTLAAAVRVPSPATIHRILVRRGLVEPQPRKRPKDHVLPGRTAVGAAGGGAVGQRTVLLRQTQRVRGVLRGEPA